MTRGGQRVAVRNGSALNFLLNDHLGSTSVMLKSNGAFWGELRYAAWGETRYTQGTLVTDRQYTGQLNDGDTGLYYYNARYYDPALHKFIQADTIVPDPNDPQTLNRYAYVNNNPLRYNDPTGHWLETAVDIGFILYDIKDIAENGLNWENGLALTADVAGAALPVVTGGGVAVRAAFHADDIADGVRVANQAVNGVQAANQVDNASDVATKADKLTGINCLHSFAGATLVTTDNGQIPISEIKVGDEVLAYNEETKAFAFYPVTVVWEHSDPEIVYLTLDGETVITTPGHLFLTDEREWIKAADLTLETEIYRADGTSREVESLKVVLSPRIMYDLTVDEAHTFTVGDGQWVAHNCGTQDKPNIVEMPSERAASRAAQREAGMGIHGERTLETGTYNPGSRPPQGTTPPRPVITSPRTGRSVHYDPWGHHYPDDTTIPPHYGVDYNDGQRATTHYTWPSKHDPRTNR